MNAIQVPDAQQDEIDSVLSVMQLSVAQAVQVGFCNCCSFIFTDLSHVSCDATSLSREIVA